MQHLSEAARVQRDLWSSDAEGWAAFSESHNRPLFAAVLAAADVQPGTRVLDIGCGTGLALRLAADRGGIVTGLDVSAEMLRVAATVAPEATLTEADLQALPYTDEAFDVVVAVNAFQFAADPRAAIVDAARVMALGGCLVVGTFGDPDGVESRVVHEAMSALSPAAREREHEPFSLSAPGALEAAMASAGLVIESSGEVDCLWHYASTADAVRGLIGSAGGTRAVQDSGVQRTTDTIIGALAPFTDPTTGEVSMRNGMRWVLSRKARA